MATQDQPLDRRIQRTRQLLHDALFALISERGYESLTVQDITERANLGRTTFYLHYQDKDELLAASIQVLMFELQTAVEPCVDGKYPYQKWCIRVFEHVAQRPQLYRALLRERGPVDIDDLMRAYFAELFQRNMLDPLKEKNWPPLKLELLAAHAAGSLFGLIAWWLNHDISPSAEKMGTIYFQLMIQGGDEIPL